MNSRLMMSLTLGALLSASVMAAVVWPVQPGWKSETIPFPLDFAPQIKYHGTEELRFSPGFRKPDAADYFTYAFVWQLDPPVHPTARELEEDLQGYFDGLMNAVAKDKKAPENVVATTAHVKGQAGSWHGTVSTWDAFFTGKPLQLDVRINEVKGMLYFEVATHPDDPAVRRELQAVRAAL